MDKQKGFTLIELLIVVAIIGLLATLAIVSLTSAQQRARDTKRVADIKAMQTAMELYFNENAEYPPLSLAGINTWAELTTEMSSFISALPVDPQHPDAFYSYGMNASTNSYTLGTTLEDTGHDSLLQDVDGVAGGVGFKGVTSTDLYDDTDATTNCADPTYCLQGVATP